MNEPREIFPPDYNRIQDIYNKRRISFVNCSTCCELCYGRSYEELMQEMNQGTTLQFENEFKH